MTFESANWEYSNMPTETEFTQPEAGDQYLVIINANYDPDACHMDIEFKSLTNGATFRIRFFMLTRNGQMNGYTGKVLRSLGRAINNEDKVLMVQDIIGAVVRANVLFTTPKDSTAKAYPKIEEFLPVPKSIVDDYSTRAGQYFED